MTRLMAIIALVLIGAAWGYTQTLAKIAVADGYRHFGLIFWQFALGILCLIGVAAWRGKWPKFDRAHCWLYLLIAVVGTILPNAAMYEAVRFLPAGLLSILVATVPIFAFPMAAALRTERFSWGRLTGLMIGLVGVVLLLSPEAALPEPGLLPYVLIGLSSSFFYALEGNYVAKWGTLDADPFQLLLGAASVGLLLSALCAWLSGSWISPHLPLSTADIALIASAFFHIFAYVGYVWLIGLTGATFAAQVGYLITGFGVFFAIIILGESYAGQVWLAMAVIFLGIFLVNPRDHDSEDDALAPQTPFGQE